jgi:hypothetical protein
MRGFLLGVIVTILCIVLGGYFFMKQGYVDFSADQPPSSTERHFAMAAVDASTDRHAVSRSLRRLPRHAFQSR